jgi:hypothetical protein
MSSTEQVVDTQSTSSRLVGQVKWFNNKAGYGFITVNDGEYAGKDIFVHYSTVRVTNSQYTYLVQGEYVEFNLTKSNTDGHEFQANDVSGIRGGSLMCEIRRNSRQQGSDDKEAPSTQDVSQRRYRVPRDSAPQRNEEEVQGEFTQVRRRKPAGPRKVPASPMKRPSGPKKASPSS